jgi:TM2 domain-containing membrane protein YozV
MPAKKREVKNIQTAKSTSGNRDKNWLTALLLSIFLGYFGIDRFYLGYIGTGILKLLITLVTLGFGGWIWWIIDIVLIATKSSALKSINWETR